jgi:hypothetical protein
MIRWTWRRLITVLRWAGRWYNGDVIRPLTVEERLKRIEYWIEVHHPLIPSSASPDEVKARGYWKGGA